MTCILKKMIKIYKPQQVDWLGYKITRKNPYSYHHCFKKIYGEYEDLDKDYLLNIGAILSAEGQAYIHSFENNGDYQGFRELNEILLELNQTKEPPTEEHWIKVKQFKERKKQSKVHDG